MIFLGFPAKLMKCQFLKIQLGSLRAGCKIDFEFQFIEWREILMALAFIVGLIAFQQVVGVRGYLIGSLGKDATSTLYFIEQMAAGRIWNVMMVKDSME